MESVSNGPVVSAAGLSLEFDAGVGVFDLDLAVGKGTIFGLIGPSGSGKTTTVRLFTGVLTPQTGSLRVLGQVPSQFDKKTRSRIGYMPQLSVLYPHLSIWENLSFVASIYGMGKHRRRRMREVLEFVELDAADDRLVQESSGGMQRRLSLAAALVHDPDLMFLDEPTTGVDPLLRRKFWTSFEGMRERGRTIFVTTQYVGEAAYCDWVGVLDNGRLLMVDTPDGLRRRAYGGDMIEVTFSEAPTPTELTGLARFAEGHSVTATSTRSVRISVPEAGRVLPEISAWALDSGVEIEGAEGYLPPFDDVFVELVTKARADAEASA